MSSACENYTLYGIMHGKADGCIKREMILCILNKQHSKTISSDKQKKHCSSCIACMVEDMMQRQCQLKHGYVTCNVHGSITVRPYRYLKELILSLHHVLNHACNATTAMFLLFVRTYCLRMLFIQYAQNHLTLYTTISFTMHNTVECVIFTCRAHFSWIEPFSVFAGFNFMVRPCDKLLTNTCPRFRVLNFCRSSVKH